MEKDPMLSDLVRLLFYYGFGVILVFLLAVLLNRSMHKMHRDKSEDEKPK